MCLIRCGRERLSDPDQSLSLEWLETNGLGGFASSTVIGGNTRRYHGLLVAATAPPVGRMVLLSKFEEIATIAGQKYELSVNRYPEVIHPRGYQYLREFRIDPFPTFVYEIEGLLLEKKIFMVHGENTTVVEYKINQGECELELRPLIAFRDYHATTHRNGALNPMYVAGEGMISIFPYSDLPTLYLSHNADSVGDGFGWYLDFEFDRERERGLDYREDLFQPFSLNFKLTVDRPATTLASSEAHKVSDVASLCEAEVRRRQSILASVPVDDELVRRLTVAADQFLVRRDSYKSVIAGYHWFSDWGRDTMISFPGLVLVPGRFAEAREILRAFAANLSEGILPNRFPDRGEKPEYNTVDATLWFFEAIRKYLVYTNDFEFVREHLYQHLKESIEWHVRGTRYGIRVDEDGLLSCGVEGVQLTWMDAKVGDYVVTPRIGKPVETQALWYNALQVMSDLADSFEETDFAASLRCRAALAKKSFNKLFWNEAAGCLYDVVDGEFLDSSIRPNQIFAVSLHHGMLDYSRAKQVVEVVDRELCTPVGLRTLSRRDPRYQPVYDGDFRSRDMAYHQGTVWPWLMGPFLSAYVKVHNGEKEALAEAKRRLRAFLDQTEVACLGQIPEIADGDTPHLPRGAVAQAWSVAELLRATVEDVYGITPERRK